MCEFGVDGFRFDAVTSIIFRDGMREKFGSYGDYFNDRMRVEGVIFLKLANALIH